MSLGYDALFTLLQSRNTRLETLVIGTECDRHIINNEVVIRFVRALVYDRHSINNEVVIGFARALANNTSLKTLDIGHRHAISSR